MSDLFCAATVADPNTMFGANASSAVSSIFNVTALPVSLTVSGLTGKACVTVEQVFGCGVGDTFEPLKSGCNSLVTLTPCQTTTVVALTGRYRLRLSDPDSLVLPSDITVYARESQVPYYGGSSMSNCGGCVGSDPNSHLPATVTSADGVIQVAQSGQGFTLDFNPVVAAAELSGSPAAVNVLKAAIVPPALPPSGPAGGALTGTYPNPSLSPAAAAAALAFVDCAAAPIAPGAALATCANLTAAVAAIPPNPTTLPPSGAAGGGLTGTYPNPGISPAAAAAALAFVSCGASPIPAGASLATCADLNAAIAALPASLPPSGPAGGGLAGTYPNPTLDSASVNTAVIAATDTAQGKVALAVGANYPQPANNTDAATPAYVQAAIAAIPAGPGSLPPSGPAGGGLAGTYPNPTLDPAAVVAAVPVATTAVQGKVALATAADFPAPLNDVDAATPAFVAAAVNAGLAGVSVTSTDGSVDITSGGPGAFNLSADATQTAIVDSNNIYTATNVNAALQEVMNTQINETQAFAGSGNQAAATVPLVLGLNTVGTFTAVLPANISATRPRVIEVHVAARGYVQASGTTANAFTPFIELVGTGFISEGQVVFLPIPTVQDLGLRSAPPHIFIQPAGGPAQTLTFNLVLFNNVVGDVNLSSIGFVAQLIAHSA